MKQTINKIFTVWEKHLYIDLLIIAVIALHSMIGLFNDQLFIGGDTGIPLNPINNLDLMYLWQNFQAGTIWWNLTAFFSYMFFAFFKMMGIKLFLIQRLYIYFAKVLCGFSMYYLSMSFSSENKRKIALLASLFYMLSPYLINYVSVFVLLPYSVMPLIFGLFIRGVNGKMHPLLSIVLINIAFWGIIINLPNYSMYAMAILFMVVYTLYNTILHKKKIWDALNYWLLFGCVSFFLQVWYILPFYMNLSQGGGVNETLKTVGVALSLEQFGDYGWAALVNLFRLFGGGMLGGGTYNMHYQYNPVLIFISFLIPTIIFSSLLFRKNSHTNIFFYIIVLIFLFISKGVNEPFGFIHYWLVKNIPIFRSFRTTYNLSVVVAIAYSYLFGFGVMELKNFVKSRNIKYIKGKFIILVISLLIFLNSWPLVTGEYYYQYSWNPPKHGGVKIPIEYFELNSFLNNNINKDSRFIIIPSNWGMLPTSWGYYGGDIAFYLFDTPYISGDYSYSGSKNSIVNLVYSILDRKDYYNSPISNESYSIYCDIMNLLNIRYLVVDGYFRPFKNKIGVCKYLEDHPYIRKVNEIGDFVIFENVSRNYLPHIYSENNIILLDGGVDIYKHLDRMPRLGNNSAYLQINNMKNSSILNDKFRYDILYIHRDGSNNNINSITQQMEKNIFNNDIRINYVIQ